MIDTRTKTGATRSRVIELGVAVTVAFAIMLVVIPAGRARAVQPVQVNSGGYHTCAVMRSGTVRCWGFNNYGQLGNGTTVDSTTPVEVIGISNAVSVDAGAYSSCARLATGRVRCWGFNGYGELGNGTTVDSTTPVSVAGLRKVTELSLGYGLACAVSDGAAKCWGYGLDGGLGNGDTQNSSVPVQVVGLRNGVIDVSGSMDGSHACGIQRGAALCWGLNDWGQLGDGSLVNSSVPVEVLRMRQNVRSIDAGHFTSCGIRGGGGRCWGRNNHGQLGDGTTTDSSVPVRMIGTLDNSVQQVDADTRYGCALRKSSVRCWGRNNFGQLGDGTTVDRLRPRRVLGLRRHVTVLSAGWFHACVIHRDLVKCWGRNDEGQLGNGTTTSSTMPILVTF